MNYRFYINEMLLTVDEWIIRQECKVYRNAKNLLETKDEITINIGLFNIKKFPLGYAKLLSIGIYTRRTLMEVSLYYKFNFGEFTDN
jgi:hypothetical protein